MAEIVAAYYHFWALSSGSRPERLAASEWSWASEFVDCWVDVFEGADLLDRLEVVAASAPSDLALAYFAAGPLEDAINSDAGLRSQVIRDRVRWPSLCDALKHVW